MLEGVFIFILGWLVGVMMVIKIIRHAIKESEEK
jgi:uncharacterized membrane protein